MPVFAQPKTTERPKNAADEAGKPIIHSASWAEDQSAVVLECVLQDSGEDEQRYVLNATDPYGSSPALRAELDRMVDEGEITITPYVPDPPEVEELPAKA